mgnify:FL=1
MNGIGGGGVGIYGEGSNGTVSGGGYATEAFGGSGGTSTTTQSGGVYGGGQGGNRMWTNATYTYDGTSSGGGAVRIIWGDNRSFPTLAVDQASSPAGETPV